MHYKRLGATGLKVSRLCLGTMTYGSSKWRDWVLDEDKAMPFFQHALEIGINFIDTADMYSDGASEMIVGSAIRQFVSNREDIVIATKCYYGTAGGGLNRCGLSRKHIMAACEASLGRLGLDYIDLYQIHRFDPDTPMEETLEAMHDLVRSGKVRYIGASNLAAWQFAKFLGLAERDRRTKFVSMQNHYNLVYREEEREMFPLCIAEGIGAIPWSPLARGFLAGNRTRGGGGDTTRAKSDGFAERLYFTDEDFAVAEANIRIAANLGVKPMQTALAWVVQNPAVTSAIIGATKLSHLDDAVGALAINLSADDRAALEEPYKPHSVFQF